ncbi:hypothetical protein KC19_3G034100 [Ceratodon purpureus]|uniref:Uncharacterized protein n=1 Tax=Ceratodon purpureus TaxID=3225 RepID=A0A8T0IGZ9_CERPU|nr:hypothetical protein KC19_3G034100 [Ceratodon purpureus]
MSSKHAPNPLPSTQRNVRSSNARIPSKKKRNKLYSSHHLPHHTTPQKTPNQCSHPTRGNSNARQKNYTKDHSFTQSTMAPPLRTTKLSISQEGKQPQEVPTHISFKSQNHDTLTRSQRPVTKPTQSNP